MAGFELERGSVTIPYTMLVNKKSKVISEDSRNASDLNELQRIIDTNGRTLMKKV